jgi:ABC-type multidrug transport system ATPase subunit
MKRLMAKIAYVKQADIFFTHLTVRDQLGYTAFLRLPQAWPHQKKLDEVERIISLLRLTKVADSKIRMLSGGEKKRVNIGTELLTDPSVLLLDEPTSGLDSTSAVALIRMLQQLARTSQKTVVTSIHQPSSALFASFDQLIMLAEGHVVYFGRPRESLSYLRTQGMACPDGYNAADHWMDLLVQDSAIDENQVSALALMTNDNNDEEEDESKTPSANDEAMEKDEYGVPIPKNLVKRKSTGQLRRERNRAMSITTRQQLIRAWDNEAVAEQMDACLDKNGASAVKDSLTDKSFSKYNTGWMLQYRTLVVRFSF